MSNNEYRELDLTRLEDLDVFIESVEDVYAESIEFQPKAKAENYQSLGNFEVPNDQIFETLHQKLTELQELINLCRNDIVPNGNEIQDFQIEKIQGLYDDMIRFRNHILDSYIDFQESTKTPVNNESVQNDDEDVGVLIDRSDEKETACIKEVDKNDCKIPNGSEINQNISSKKVVEEQDIYASAEHAVEEVVRTVNDVNTRMLEVFSSSKKTKDIEIYLAELEQCAARAKDLEKSVEDSRNTKEEGVVLKSNLNRYIRVAREIRVNAKVIEQVLLKKSSAETKEEGKKEVLENNQNLTKEEVSINTSEEQLETVKVSDDSDNDDEKAETFTPLVRRMDMVILPDTESDKDVPIYVTETARLRLEKQLGKSLSSTTARINTTAEEPKPMIVEARGLPNYMSVVAELENQDPINVIVTDKVPTINHLELAPKETPFQRKYLNEERYQSFIRARYSSPAAFERMLDNEVVKIENGTVDAIEKFFGDTFASSFSYLKNMTVAEVLSLSNKPEIKFELQAKDIKYETFVTWIDLIIEMQTVVGDNPDMTFGELFDRWIIETEINYHSSEVKVPQFTG